jgi:hypothetical protein
MRILRKTVKEKDIHNKKGGRGWEEEKQKVNPELRQ